MSGAKPKRMLVILAHPDDEGFVAGGTLARYAHQNVQVILLCATRGEAGIPGVNNEEAGDTRERELRQAAEHLGIEVHFLGYPDGGLAQTKPEAMLETIACWIDLIQPQVILTFGPEGVSGHPDHVTISHIVTQAYDLSYNKGLLLYIRPSEATVLGCGVSSSRTDDGQPLVEIDISDYRLNKARAIQCHASQNPGLPGGLEDEMDKIPCSELYTVARDARTADNYPEWFETVTEEESNAIREQEKSIVSLHR
ncbi:MAG: PIG-L family deacetylase [Chloroflexi bacterium]|nr:PIG-L family deacetylase [Chloroflexota bacterium]